jgi:hypothetical protein
MAVYQYERNFVPYHHLRDCLSWIDEPDICLQIWEQHEKLKSCLGPLYLFYFCTSCFSLMFFSFNIYLGLTTFDVTEVGSLAYGSLALGTTTTQL